VTAEVHGAHDPMPIELTVNGVTREVAVPPRTLLSDTLRHHLGLTGTHVGCEQGACGACTVLVDGEPMRSCLVLAPQAAGRSIETIESVAGTDGSYDRVQQALHDEHGLQCGYCTPGIVMSMVAARRRGAPVVEATDDLLGGHLCRCTGYVNIRSAIRRAFEPEEGA
jgi:aerobic-type carbon monoxide dehydrogenase small subunit (CoxS/CutS family)